MGPEGTEGFTIWLMPLDYVSQVRWLDPTTSGSSQPVPERLGSNSICQVFCLTSVDSQPTWPNWKQEIKRLLEVDSEARSSARKARRLECADLKACVLLGEVTSPQGVGYMLKLSTNAPMTYFVQPGDYIGDHMLDDRGYTPKGRPKVVLKKGDDIISLWEKE